MQYSVWFAHGYANAELLGKYDDYTSAVSAANRAAELGSEDIEILNENDQVMYKIGFSSFNEFAEMI